MAENCPIIEIVKSFATDAVFTTSFYKREWRKTKERKEKKERKKREKKDKKGRRENEKKRENSRQMP